MPKGGLHDVQAKRRAAAVSAAAAATMVIVLAGGEAGASRPAPQKGAVNTVSTVATGTCNLKAGFTT